MTTTAKGGINRRHVLMAGSAAGALAVGGAVAGAPGGALAATVTPVAVRPDIASAEGKRMLGLYAKAVAAMQDPAINTPPQPQSWTFQSFIHGVPENEADPAHSAGLRVGTPEMAQRIDSIYGNPAKGTPQYAWKQAALATWGSCPHSSPWFLAWHRWYVFYFERVVRRMSGAADFVLPYWNYGVDVGDSLKLPAEFRDKTSPLFFQDRGPGFDNPLGKGKQTVPMNDGGYMPFGYTDYRPALDARPFFPSDTTEIDPNSPEYQTLGSTGRIESMPHDYVHDNVGGWMGNVPSAAGDPVFYVHHCQIDRLWSSWAAIKGSAYNWGDGPEQPSKAEWTTKSWQFVDETGKLVTVRAGDTFETTAAPFRYRYDDLAKPTPPVAVVASASVPNVAAAVATGGASAGLLHMASMRGDGLVVGSEGGRITLAPEAPRAAVFGVTGAASAARPPKAAAAQPAVLELEGIKLLRRPPAPLHVFVNLPAGAEPTIDSPFHVGALSLFSFDARTGQRMEHDNAVGGRKDGGHAGHGHGGASAHADPSSNSIRYNVKDILARQKASGAWDGGAVTVTVTTLGADTSKGNAYIAISTVSLLP